MITIKEYAKKHNVSYEAVRQQMERYKDLLEGHIITNGRFKYIDAEAERILDEKRANAPVIIYDEERLKDYEDLMKENKRLHEELEKMLNRVVTLQGTVMEAQAITQKTLQENALLHEKLPDLEKMDQMKERIREQDERIHHQEGQISEKDKRISEQSAQIEDSISRISSLQEQNTALNEQSRQQQDTITSQGEEITRLRGTEKTLEDVRRAADQVKEELTMRLEKAESDAGSYERTWFGLYRKKY